MKKPPTTSRIARGPAHSLRAGGGLSNNGRMRVILNPAGIVFRILCFRDALGVDIVTEDRLRRLGN